MSKENELGLEGTGVAVKPIDELDSAIEAYLPIKEKRVELTNKEKDAKKKVIDLLHAHKDAIGTDGEGVMHYRCGDYIATLAPTKEKLTVKLDEDEEEE